MRRTSFLSLAAVCLLSGCGSSDSHKETVAVVEAPRVEIPQQVEAVAAPDTAVEMPNSYFITQVQWRGTEVKTLIPRSSYLFYAGQNPRPSNYSEYVNAKDPKVIELAKFLTKDVPARGKAQALLDYVHGLFYDREHESLNDYEYIKYPLETIVERGGDCEDLSILYASLAQSVGLDTILLYFDAPHAEVGAKKDLQVKDKKEGHLAVGVAGEFSGTLWTQDKKEYFFAETTGTDWQSQPVGWKIGQFPKDLPKRATILRVR